MIIYRSGDVFAVEDTDTILHGVNNKGVMGSGVAKIVRDRFPTAYRAYRREYDRHGLPLGSFYVIKAEENRTIINAVTQDGYGYDGKAYVSYDAIATIFEGLNQLYVGKKIAMPMIGAGLGGGDWNIISEIIEELSRDFTAIVYKF